MTQRLLLIACLLSAASVSQAQQPNRAGGDPKLSEYYDPAIRVVAPGKTAADAPADAVVLFRETPFPFILIYPVILPRLFSWLIHFPVSRFRPSIAMSYSILPRWKLFIVPFRFASPKSLITRILVTSLFAEPASEPLSEMEAGRLI